MAKRSVEERIAKIREVEEARLLKCEAEADVRKKLEERLCSHVAALEKALDPLNGIPLDGSIIQVIVYPITTDRRSVSVFKCRYGQEKVDGKLVEKLLPANPPVISFMAFIDVSTSEAWYQFGSQRVKPHEALDYALIEIERKLQ